MSAENQTLATVLGGDKRPTIVEECAQLVDDEVKSKSGLTGVAIKGAYGTVKKLKPGFLPEVIDGMLDDWLARLEPHFASWKGSSTSFEEFVTRRADDVAEDLLSVTDERAATTKHKTAKKLYDKLRGSAKRNVSAAVPRLGALVDRHVGG